MRKTSGFVVFFVLIAAFSCSRPPLAEHEASSTNLAQRSAGIRSGTLIYETGDVMAKETGDWHQVTFGDSVAENATVKTARDSNCEIQFGKTSIVYIAENTTVVLRTLAVTEAHKAIDMELLGGSVIAKVAKLAGNDHFQVRTDTVVCGVRGTKFNVNKRADDTTSVAVAEGAVALMPPSFNPVALENASASPDRRELAADVANRVAIDSPVVGVNTEVVVTKATMTKADTAVKQLLATLVSTASAPVATGAARLFPPAVTQALEDYAHAVPTTNEVAPKPFSADVQQTFQQTINMQILETLPAASPSNISQPAPLSRTPLPTPRALSPGPDVQIDINKTDSIRFTWEAVPNAASYKIDLYRTSGGTKTLVKSWTTSDLSVVFDQFGKIDLGTFSWEVSALPQSSDRGSTKSDPAVSDFEIVKAGTLQAPSMKKLPAPQIKMPGEKSSGSSP